MPLHWKNYNASLPRCSPPQEQDTLDEVSTSRFREIVIPPFIYPSKVLCPQLLRVQYVIAVVNVVVPRLDKRRNSGLVEMFDADLYAHSLQLNSRERRGEGLIRRALAHSNGSRGNVSCGDVESSLRWLPASIIT